MTYPMTSYALVCRYLNITIEYGLEFSERGIFKISVRMR